MSTSKRFKSLSHQHLTLLK